MYKVLKYILTTLLNFMSHTFFFNFYCWFFWTFLTSFFLEWDAWSPLTLSVSIRPEFEITSAFLGFVTKILLRVNDILHLFFGFIRTLIFRSSINFTSPVLFQLNASPSLWPFLAVDWLTKRLFWKRFEDKS